jgi:hypothetical protein
MASAHFRVGHKIDPHAVLIQWLPETKARAIIKRAASARFPARALCRQQQPD